ncbi:unnamed protein product, partial [Mesorhabditis spiculigera]
MTGPWQLCRYCCSSPAAHAAITVVSDAYAKYTEIWSNVSQPGFDGIEKMRKFADAADTILGLAGALVQAALNNTTDDPKSDDVRARNQLLQDIDTQEEAIRQWLFEGFPAQRAYSAGMEWDTKIGSVVPRLGLRYQMLLELPKSSNFRDRFKELCFTEGPGYLFQELFRLIVPICPIPKKSAILHSISATKAVRRIESKLLTPRSSISTEFSQAKADFIYAVGATREREANTMLSDISKGAFWCQCCGKQEPTSFEEFTKLLKGITKTSYQWPCHLWASVQNRGFTRESMDQELQLLIVTMKSLILFGTACEDVKMNGIPGGLEDWQNEAIDWVRKISSHAADWASTVQELSWPECATEHAEARLWKQKPATADEAASIVRHAHEDTGPKAWKYQTLAHPGDWEPEQQYAVRAINGTYANVTNAEGWTVHVFKFNSGDDAFSSRVEEAKIRLQEEDYAVKRALR